MSVEVTLTHETEPTVVIIGIDDVDEKRMQSGSPLQMNAAGIKIILFRGRDNAELQRMLIGVKR